MSNKIDEAFYNSLDSPQRQATQRPDDNDYTNVDDDESYQKLNPAGAMAKNMYSSLVTSCSKAPIPQDYLTPVMSDLKEQYKLSNTASPVIVKEEENNKKRQTTYLWILLLVLTCISLLLAAVAVILAIIALSKASSTNNTSISTSEVPPVVTTEELRVANISTVELDKKLLELYKNITTQLNALMQFIGNVESTGNTLQDEVMLIKGVYLSK